jgi:hypothetical protein
MTNNVIEQLRTNGHTKLAAKIERTERDLFGRNGYKGLSGDEQLAVINATNDVWFRDEWSKGGLERARSGR